MLLTCRRTVRLVAPSAFPFPPKKRPYWLYCTNKPSETLPQAVWPTSRILQHLLKMSFSESRKSETKNVNTIKLMSRTRKNLAKAPKKFLAHLAQKIVEVL